MPKFDHWIIPVPGVDARVSLVRARTDHETVVRVQDAERKVIYELRVPSTRENPVEIPISADARHIEVEGEAGDRVHVSFPPRWEDLSPTERDHLARENRVVDLPGGGKAWANPEAHAEAVARAQADVVTIGMDYDGPADDNPHVPAAGEVVARCPHEPRPMHARIMAGATCEGVRVHRVNLCRACGSTYPLVVPDDVGFHLYTWTQADVDRVRAAGRAR